MVPAIKLQGYHSIEIEYDSISILLHISILFHSHRLVLLITNNFTIYILSFITSMLLY